jgi:hypothetical protein
LTTVAFSEFEPFDEAMFNELQELQLATDSLLVQVTGFRREYPKVMLAMLQEKQEKEGHAISEAKEKRKVIADEAMDPPSKRELIIKKEKRKKEVSTQKTFISFILQTLLHLRSLSVRVWKL